MEKNFVADGEMVILRQAIAEAHGYENADDFFSHLFSQNEKDRAEAKRIWDANPWYKKMRIRKRIFWFRYWLMHPRRRIWMWLEDHATFLFEEVDHTD